MRDPHPNGCSLSKLVCRHRPIALFTSTPLQGLPGVQLRAVRGKSEGWWLWAYSHVHAALNLRRRVTHPEQLFLNDQVRCGQVPIRLLNHEQTGIFQDAVIVTKPMPQLPLVFTPPQKPPPPELICSACKGASRGGQLPSLSLTC